MKCPNCDGVGAKRYEDGLWCQCPACYGKGAVMQANGLPTYSELEAEIERLNRIISGGISVASAHGVERLELRRRIDAQEETIARQAAQLVEYASMLDTERATVASLRAQLAERDAEIAHMIAHMWDGVPVAQLRRQYNIESMTVHDFGLDAQDVDKWLRSLDGDA